MKKNKKLLILIILLVLVIAGGGTLAFMNHRGEKASDKSSEPTGVNLSPATSDDKKRSEANKDRLAKEQQGNSQTNTGTSTNTKAVKPIITYAGQYSGQVQIGAYVNGILESNGTCEAVMTKDGQTLKKQVKAVPNVNSTDCPEMSFTDSDLVSKGDWTLTVSYTSTTASGTSDSKIVKVQ